MTAQELADQFSRSAEALPREILRASEHIGEVALNLSRQLMEQQIYAIPEATTKAGKKKWVRTRQLLNAETFDRSELPDVIITNDMPYAEPRHEAGKPGRRNISPLRESHWEDDMFEQMAQFSLDRWDDAVQIALEIR